MVIVVKKDNEYIKTYNENGESISEINWKDEWDDVLEYENGFFKIYMYVHSETDEIVETFIDINGNYIGHKDNGSPLYWREVEPFNKNGIAKVIDYKREDWDNPYIYEYWRKINKKGEYIE